MDVVPLLSPTPLDHAALRAALIVAALLLAPALLRAVLAAAARAPGALGRRCFRWAHRVRPGLVARGVALLVGLVTPLTASAPASAAPLGARPDAAAAHPAPGRAPAHPARAPHAGTAGVVVRRGDTLWDIARRHLRPGAPDAEVARAWPRWYAANRAVIGPDPDLLLPGTRLRPPRTVVAGPPDDRRATRSAVAPVPAADLDPDRR